MKIGATEILDVPTGGDPEAAITAAALRMTEGQAHAIEVAVKHDETCPCLTGHPVGACTCEIVRLEGTRVA